MAIVSLSGQYAGRNPAIQHTTGQTGEVGQKASLDAAKVQAVTDMVNRDYHAGKFDWPGVKFCVSEIRQSQGWR